MISSYIRKQVTKEVSSIMQEAYELEADANNLENNARNQEVRNQLINIIGQGPSDNRVINDLRQCASDLRRRASELRKEACSLRRALRGLVTSPY